MRSLVILSLLTFGCSGGHPLDGTSWLEADTSRYETDPLRVNGGAYYQIDRHAVSFGVGGAWYDEYRLDVLTWQYTGTWSGNGGLVTTDERGAVSRTYALGSDGLTLDGYRYVPITQP